MGLRPVIITKRHRKTHSKSALSSPHLILERAGGEDLAFPAAQEAMANPRLRSPKAEFPCTTVTTGKRWTHTYTHRHTEDADIQHRKGMNVLKIAQNPLHLQTSERLKALCQEIRPLPRGRPQGPLV